MWLSKPATHVFTTTLAALMLVACADGGSEEVARSDPISLEQVARIGCVDCVGDAAITPIALALLDGGEIAVLDRFEPFVRLFSPQGELLASAGTKGQGPGELGLGTGNMYLPGSWIFANHDGGATVVDLFPAVLESFRTDGTFSGQTTTGLAEAVPVSQAFDPETRTYFRLSFSPLAGDESRVVARCRFAGTPDDGCTTFTTPERFLDDTEARGGLGALALAAAPGGSLVVADARSYRIWVLDDAGEIAVQTGRDVPLHPKSEAELQQEREFAASRGVDQRAIRAERPHLIPKGVQVDGNGRIWVLTGRYDDNGAVLDVFAPDGSFLAEVTVDGGIHSSPWIETPLVIRGDTMLRAVGGPDGDDEIRVYRIRD